MRCLVPSPAPLVTSQVSRASSGIAVVDVTRFQRELEKRDTQLAAIQRDVDALVSRALYVAVATVTVTVTVLLLVVQALRSTDQQSSDAQRLQRELERRDAQISSLQRSLEALVREVNPHTHHPPCPLACTPPPYRSKHAQ
jgi:hypothetical protein